MPVHLPGYILNHLRRRSSVWIFAFFHIILKKSWRTFSNLRRDLWVERYIRRAGWFTYAKRIRCEYKNVQRRYIQEEPGIKATAQEKSHFSRKSTHFQFKHDFGTTSALARCTLIWAGDSPRFDFPLVSSSTKKKVHRNRPSAIFPPHTSYNHKCYSFTRKKGGDGKFSPP